jgi:outer membrane protein assembly factor BamB
MIIVTIVALPPFVSADWSMFRSDPSHSGVGTDNPKGSPVLTPTQLWKTNFTWTSNQMEAQRRRRSLTEPVVIDDTVYVGVSSNVIVSRYESYSWTDVYAFNANNGTQIWAYRVDTHQITNPAFANGIVYFGQNHDNHNFYALNASTYTLVWNATVDFSVNSSPTVVDGVVYVGGGMGIFYALNASNGDKIWNANVGYNVASSSPAIANGMVYVGSFDGMHALNASNGDKIWNYFGGDFHGACSVAKGVVYAMTQRANIHAFNASNGAKLWNYSISDGWIAIDPSFAIVNDVVYARNGLGNLYALNAVSGAKIWNFTWGYDSSAPTAVNDVIYFGACNGLYALNASNGELLWNYTKSDGFGSQFVSPVVVNGVAYVSDFYGDRQLYAIAVPYMPPSQPPFPVATIVVAVTAVAVVVACAGLLLHFKKRKQ